MDAEDIKKVIDVSKAMLHIQIHGYDCGCSICERDKAFINANLPIADAIDKTQRN